jgi:prepilin-type processing-associated H-X9-DG protein
MLAAAALLRGLANHWRFSLASAAGMSILGIGFGVAASQCGRASGRHRQGLLAVAFPCLVLALSAALLIKPILFPEVPDYRMLHACGARMSDLRGGLSLYQLSHGGELPPVLDDLLADPAYSQDMLRCPSDPASPLASYSYFGRGLTWASNPRCVLLMERLENHGGAGANVLRLDGSVAFVKPPVARRFLADLRAGVNPPRE